MICRSCGMDEGTLHSCLGMLPLSVTAGRCGLCGAESTTMGHACVFVRDSTPIEVHVRVVALNHQLAKLRAIAEEAIHELEEGARRRTHHMPMIAALRARLEELTRG